MQKVENKKFRIWGLVVEEIMFDGKIWWKIEIGKPFFKDGWKFGLNQKLFKKAWERGVEKFIIEIGQREIMMDVPREKDIKEKEKRNEYEDKPSMFAGSSPMRIYHFNLVL